MARRGEHTKEELKSMAVLAAERLLARDGLAGLSVRKIANAIGYAPGSLYTVFNSLDDLLLELNGRTIDELNVELTAAVDSAAKELFDASTPEPSSESLKTLSSTSSASCKVADSICSSTREQLIKMADGYINFAHNNENRWRLAFEHTLPDVGDLPDHLQAKIDSTYALVSKVLEPLVPVDREQLAAATLWSQVHGLCILTLNNKIELGGVKSIKQAMDFAIENYLAGLMQNLNAIKAKTTQT